MKSKQLLITVYFETDQNDLVLDHNTDEDYDYEKCITKVIAHFELSNHILYLLLFLYIYY